VMPRFLNRR